MIWEDKTTKYNRYEKNQLIKNCNSNYNRNNNDDNRNYYNTYYNYY